jgi:hypothetical protein
MPGNKRHYEIGSPNPDELAVVDPHEDEIALDIPILVEHQTTRRDRGFKRFYRQYGLFKNFGCPFLTVFERLSNDGGGFISVDVWKDRRLLVSFQVAGPKVLEPREDFIFNKRHGKNDPFNRFGPIRPAPSIGSPTRSTYYGRRGRGRRVGPGFPDFVAVATMVEWSSLASEELPAVLMPPNL